MEEMFGANKTYIVPAYQRPYSWRCLGKTDQNNQVNRMWDDVWEFFSENGSDETEYFLGSMVVIQQQEARSFEVVDGQQRLTTLALLFAAMSCFLKSHCENPALATFRDRSVSTLEKLLYNYSGVALVQTLKVKILRVAGFDYNDVVARAVRCEPSAGVTDSRYAEIAQRYFDNRDYFIDRLKEHFLTDGELTIPDAERFNSFFTFLHVRVAIVLITTTSFDTAFMIFETLNNRGLPLTNLDLLRNLLLKELTEANVEDPPKAWTVLEEESLTEEFMGRWVESWRAQQQKSSAFNDLLKIYETDPAFQGLPGDPKVLRFYNTIRRDLCYFSLVAEPRARVAYRAIRNKIRFFRVAGNERYSINLLLALFRALNYAGDESEVILDFLCAYQRFMLYVLLAPGARFGSAKIYQAIGHIKAGRLDAAQHVFDLDADAADRLKGYLSGELRDNATARLILAEYVWHNEATTDDVVEQELRWDEASLEHIIPQNPDATSQWLTDFDTSVRKELTYRLGNMTLLTTKMNAAAKNFDFSRKKEHYKKTLLPITRDLVAINTITPEVILRRHEQLVAGVLASLRLPPTSTATGAPPEPAAKPTSSTA